MMPAGALAAENWTLFDFESVFAAFRDDDVFGSEMYNNTIGLVFGPTILGMHGKQHHDHRSLVAKAFRQSALDAVGTRGDRPDLRSTGRRDQERRRGRSGQGGDIRVPHPRHRRAAGPAAGGPRDVPAVVAGPDLDHRGHRGGSERVGRIGHLLPGPGGPATQHDDRRHHRRSRRARRSTARSSPTKRSSRSCGCCCPPGWRPPIGRRATCCTCCSRIPTNCRRCSRIATSSRPRSKKGIRYETPLVMVPRNTTRDVEMHGMPIPEGAQVNLCMGSANRDEKRWDRRRRVRHPPAAARAHLLRGRHPQLPRHAPGPSGNEGDAEQPLRSGDRPAAGAPTTTPRSSACRSARRSTCP